MSNQLTVSMLVLFTAGFLAFAHDANADNQLGLPSYSTPADNPLSREKIELGRKIFFDKRFSSDGTISCASCHDPDKAFTDGRQVAQGMMEAKSARNTPTLANVVFYASFFWDGRRATLEEQAGDPFINPQEHGLKDHFAVIRMIQNDLEYVTAFENAFGISRESIAFKHVAKALASFERSLLSGNSEFDRYMYGRDKNALSVAAARGLELFRGRARCAVCHVIGADSATFSDNQFHSLGIGFKRVEPRLAQVTVQVARAQAKSLDAAVLSNAEISELGRFAVTLKPVDINRFKTPSLRNVAVTAPYMHDGSVQTLEDAVELEVYYRGIQTSRPLILTSQEKNDLVHFLRSLTSAEYKHIVTSSTPDRDDER